MVVIISNQIVDYRMEYHIEYAMGNVAACHAEQMIRSVKPGPVQQMEGQLIGVFPLFAMEFFRDFHDIFIGRIKECVGHNGAEA
jgi:hypothetical protein